MAIFARAFSKKDTWITEQSVTSNFGASPILEVWAKWNPYVKVKQRSRILIQFNLSALSANIVNTKSCPDPRIDSNVTAYMYMRNAKHGQDQAENFNIDVFPLTASWQEGQGVDNDKFSNTGFANAISASNTNTWNYDRGGTGGNVYIGWDSWPGGGGNPNVNYDSNSATQYFETGQEDLKVDVTNYFKAYLNYATGTSIPDGGSADHGFLVRMGDKQEAVTGPEAVSAGVPASTSATNFFTKKFYSRETNTRKMPYIQLEWPGEIKDNRAAIKFSNTGNLFFYNLVDGELTDLNGNSSFPGYVNLSANGVDLVTSSASGGELTASRHSKGIYKLNIGSATNRAGTVTTLTGINLALSSSTSFVDSWVVTTLGQELTNNFSFDCVLPISGFQNFQSANYQISLANLRDRYEKGSLQRIRVFLRDKSTEWAAVTGTTSAMKTAVVNNASVEIRELVTNDIEVPAMGLSFDKNGNFFDLDTNLLYEGMQYKLVIVINEKGETIHYDRPNDWQFQIGTVYDINRKSGY